MPAMAPCPPSSDSVRREPSGISCRQRSWSEARSSPNYIRELEDLPQLMLAEAQSGDLTARRKPATVFDGANVMRFSDLLIRMVKYLQAAPAVYFLAALHIGRCTLHVRSTNVQRLFVAAVLVTAKFQEESYDSALTMSRVCGLSLREVRTLELEFLRIKDWNLCISAHDFEHFRELVHQWTTPDTDEMEGCSAIATSVKEVSRHSSRAAESLAASV
eukprot:TRINITY_DN7291_c0_g1_i1.p2 TRINITY_DN7291_c0_g1~~TRINITY_DN7291_c0_g1_i1.p2  ORF type:complete len:217 (+),score=79.15 TRINITY_DN7291_c0_g1_i1:84-734(+)